MKNSRPVFYLFIFLIALAFASSCSSPKQVFYFQPGPATPKVVKQQPPAEPVYTASNELSLADLPLTTLANLAETKDLEKASVKSYSKKEVRQLVRRTVKALKDTTDTRNKDRGRVSVTANKDRLARLEAEAQELKNSVRVQNSDSKVKVDVKKPVSDLSQTELILVGVAALLVLIILLSLPVIGNILGAILGIALIAAAVAILLGYIEINI